jgi:hypothetical protein
MRSYWCATALLSIAVFPQDGRELTFRYATEIDRQLQLPVEEQQFYGAELSRLFAGSGPQFIALVDRSPNVQAFLLYWRGADGVMHWIGASPVSTGHPGRFDYFETPLGVFDHTVDNPDYRAEGTRNANGICGYGVKGMRVYDFGWVRQNKGWGDRAEIEMRFQMHATDADFLEPKLGTAQSKGCIRIPGTLNRFLDNYGVLDADYVRAVAEGGRPFVLDRSWHPVAGAGRYLVVIDSDRAQRPAWAVPTPKPAPPRVPRPKPAYPPTGSGPPPGTMPAARP